MDFCATIGSSWKDVHKGQVFKMMYCSGANMPFYVTVKINLRSTYFSSVLTLLNYGVDWFQRAPIAPIECGH